MEVLVEWVKGGLRALSEEGKKGGLERKAAKKWLERKGAKEGLKS